MGKEEKLLTLHPTSGGKTIKMLWLYPWLRNSYELDYIILVYGIIDFLELN